MSSEHRSADLVVIGAGSGGLSVAAGAAQLGLDVVLFEKGEMGGDCLNYGCVPSKALIAAAKQAEAMRQAGRFGIGAVDPEIDWKAVQAHVRGVIATIAPVDSQERFEGFGVTVIREAAKFVDRQTVASASMAVKARRIVVATGSRALVPPIAGLAETPFLTNETIFDVPELPRHLIVLGGGPIGIELAQAFRRLGSEVTVLEAARALARADADQARTVLSGLRAEGIQVLEGFKAVSVSGGEGDISVQAEAGAGASQRQTVKGSHLLVALGRAPVLDLLDLAAGGVDHTRAGITTRANLRSVSNPRVWAVGDAAGQGQFTHLAGWHASVFVRNALFKSPTKASSAAVPAVTYCDPEIAQIGLTEEQARARHGDAMKVVKWALHENDRAQSERDVVGETKLVLDPKGKILGASILGEGAGDILQIVSLAMAKGLGVRALTEYISPYPTRAETIKRAAGAFFTPVLFSKRTRWLVSLLQRIP
jgi:pyruvate/2-oxoglutarate dehydrogenase complex dihydrolipoamide dehydrogenase (E3) component